VTALPLMPSCGLVASKSTFSEAMACNCVAFSSTLPVMKGIGRCGHVFLSRVALFVMGRAFEVYPPFLPSHTIRSRRERIEASTEALSQLSLKMSPLCYSPFFPISRRVT